MEHKNTNEVDPVEQARDLAVLFQNFAAAVFGYRRLHFNELTEDQRNELDDRGNDLLDVAEDFTADAIAATLTSLQADLDRITKVASEAKESLKTLNDVQQALAIVGAGLALATAVSSGNLGGIVSALQGLVTAVHPAAGAASGE